jgi:ABC-type lipoprotein export system ATPase subunit
MDVAPAQKLAQELLQQVGLYNRKSHKPAALSGGERQRVAIASALDNNPTLVHADEPTGNLDTKTGEMVLDTFQRLHQEQGRTIVLITHEPYVAEHAERVINIRDGNIVEDGKVKNRRVINNHNHIAK